MCVASCPTASHPDSFVGASVADPNTKVCQAVCNGSLFADYVAGLCVSKCKTNNTYADINYGTSGYTCVTTCNQTGATPWK